MSREETAWSAGFMAAIEDGDADPEKIIPQLIPFLRSPYAVAMAEGMMAAVEVIAEVSSARAILASRKVIENG